MCIIYMGLLDNQKNRTKRLFLLVNTEEIHLSLSTTNEYKPSVSLIDHLREWDNHENVRKWNTRWWGSCRYHSQNKREKQKDSKDIWIWWVCLYSECWASCQYVLCDGAKSHWKKQCWVLTQRNARRRLIWNVSRCWKMRGGIKWIYQEEERH